MKILNPNVEILNKSEYLMTKTQDKFTDEAVLSIRILVIKYCIGFRAPDLGFKPRGIWI